MTRKTNDHRFPAEQAQKETVTSLARKPEIDVRSFSECSANRKASREIISLLEQGVFVTSNSPNYYTRLGELKLEMLAEAAKDARNRAENIPRSAGNTGIGPRGIRSEVMFVRDD